jgi:predicted nucleic acid-binding protein
MKYYFDTCIWIDYFNERDAYVVDVVFKILSNYTILVSELVFAELNKHVDNLSLLGFKNIILVEIFDTQRKLATAICEARNIPFGDALHAIIARDNNAILITRDKHFLKLRDIATIKLL